MMAWFHRLYPPIRPLAIAARRLMQHDGIEISGFIAYTALVSLFPFVIFLFSLAGFIGSPETAQAITNEAFDLLPDEVARTLMPIVQEVFTKPQPGLLTLGIVGTLWVTSSGVEALRMGCMRSWEMKEKRPLWRRRLTSFAFVAIGAFSALAASLIMVAAPIAQQWLTHVVRIPQALIILTTLLRVLVAGALLASCFAVLYRYLPPRNIAWRAVWPGAWLASLLWIVLASLFSYYLSQSADYTVTYGSLGGVVITLLFLHFSAMLFLLGVEYNAVLVHKRTSAASVSVASHRAAG